MAKFRLALAALILLGFAATTARLAPPYIQNWKLQSYLNGLSEDASTAAVPPAVLEARVMDKASSLGIPLHTGDVTVERHSANLHIRALYVVRVDLPLYTVDLHFRPEAGGV